jgi:PEP-CTERM motif-containing protein
VRALVPAVLLSLLTLFPGTSQGTAFGPGITELFGPGDFSIPSTVIDFDDAPDATAANTLYLAQGIEFENTGGVVPIMDWASIPRVTVSLPNVIGTVLDYEGTGSDFSEFLDLLFTAPTLEVGTWFGNDQGILTVPVTLSVFDASNTLLGFVTQNATQNTSVDQFIGLRSTTPFTRARVEYQVPIGDLSVVLDDVQFTTPIPEPSSLALLGCGLGLLARRRRKRAPHPDGAEGTQ